MSDVSFPTMWGRLTAVLLLALTLGACATRPDQVDVSVGVSFPQAEPAPDYAALYAPYAMMATLAYANANVLTALNHCPDPGKLDVRQAGDSDETFGFNQTLRGWVRDLGRLQWQCRFGLVGNLPCPPRLGPGCTPLGGLQLHVWRRVRGGVCREVVIAFRGTDRNDRGDWTSNFRFLYRLEPRFDQYDQVRAHIRRVVARVKQSGCSRALFVATGHSLGAGLAQQAAYSEGAIRYVYAFDPSPVTGLFDISAVMRERNARGLGVDRAYEAGEILTLPRILIENIIPPSYCNPRVRTVRFNLLTGSPVEQHSITALATKLRESARTPGADPQRVIALRQAESCTAPPFVQSLVPPA